VVEVMEIPQVEVAYTHTSITREVHQAPRDEWQPVRREDWSYEEPRNCFVNKNLIRQLTLIKKHLLIAESFRCNFLPHFIMSKYLEVGKSWAVSA
jgi:hypothetical protein